MFGPPVGTKSLWFLPNLTLSHFIKYIPVDQEKITRIPGDVCLDKVPEYKDHVPSAISEFSSADCADKDSNVWKLVISAADRLKNLDCAAHGRNTQAKRAHKDLKIYRVLTQL